LSLCSQFLRLNPRIDSLKSGVEICDRIFYLWEVFILKTSVIRNRSADIPKLINAKGMGCAEPVIVARKSLQIHDEIIIEVDEPTALTNLRALAVHEGYAVSITGEPGETYSVHIKKK